MNIALVGAGAVASHHARAAQQIEGIRLAAVASRTRERAEKLAREFGAVVYQNSAEVFQDRNINLVIICTLPDLHGALAVEAARAGKHVLVEKPLDISLEGAFRTLEECRKNGVVLAVVSQKRFTDGARFLRNAIVQRHLGKIIQADTYMKWYRDAAYYDRPGKGAWNVEGGGALINQAIHQIDLLRWMMGPVERLRCEWQLASSHQMESEDNASALLRFKNGAIGVVQASTSCYPGFPERLEIHGTGGSAITEGDFLKAWEVMDSALPRPPQELFQKSQVGASRPLDIAVEPFRRQLENVVHAIRNAAQPLIPGEEGVETLRLVLAMYQSARENREVTL